MKFKYRISVLMIVISIGLHSQTTVIENINVINVETGKVISEKHVLIEGDKIQKVSDKKIKTKKEVNILDGTGQYLIPGLIDSHIHFFQSGGVYTRPDILNLTSSTSYTNEISFAESIVVENFKRYLYLGITSVVDVGGPFSNFKIRDSLAKKNLSPNILVTGPLFSPYQPEVFSNLKDTPIAKINSIAQADSLFQRMIPYKPDLIKIWYIVNDENPAEKTFPIVEHIANLTHSKGIKLAVHATSNKTAELAVKAGADVLVHSVRDTTITDSFIKLLKKNKVSYNPTLIVSKNYVKTLLSELDLHPQDIKYANSKAYGSTFDLKSDDLDKPNKLKDFIGRGDNIKKYHKYTDSIMAKNLKSLVEAGVNVITGTDAGNIGTMHASSYIQEIEAMKSAGLANSDILKSSTINAARAFGLDTKLGTIEVGKVADLLILEENPLEDLSALNKISAVFKDGNQLDLSKLLEESPESIVQRQVNAYNARNIDAFMDTYSEDIKIYSFPNKVTTESKEEMRKSFSKMFERIPNLYCEIKNRIVLGNKVIDREHVRFGDKYSDVIAIYEVKNGKISKVTFVR